MMRKALTMVELLVVVIIVGILATLSLSYLKGMKDKVADKEAINNLILLSAAQRDYHMDQGVYCGTTSHSVIRNGLNVRISNNANRLWNYSVKTNGCVQAQRFGGGKNWSMQINDADGKPDENTLCP